jgi:hypothetical protein
MRAPCNNISHIWVVVIYFFPNPIPIQTENGKTAYMWELLIANHLDQIIMFDHHHSLDKSQIFVSCTLLIMSPFWVQRVSCQLQALIRVKWWQEIKGYIIIIQFYIAMKLSVNNTKGVVSTLPALDTECFVE